MRRPQWSWVCRVGGCVFARSASRWKAAVPTSCPFSRGAVPAPPRPHPSTASTSGAFDVNSSTPSRGGTWFSTSCVLIIIDLRGHSRRSGHPPTPASCEPVLAPSADAALTGAMRVVIAGGHGKIALILERLLADGGHEPMAIIRNPDHRDDVEAAGATAVVLDLEAASVDQVAQVLRGADAG